MAKLTVIIPLYNKSAYIKRALESVFAQTWTDYEVIVVDDGSTDGGPDAVAEIVAQRGETRVRLIRQANAGPGHARNRGIDEANSEYVAFLDADDEWMPRFLESSVEALDEAGPEVGCISSGYILCPAGLSTAAMWRKRGLRDGMYRVTPHTDAQYLVHLLAYLTPPTTVARLESVRRWGGFCRHGRCVYGEDSYLWIKLLLNESVLVNLEPHVKIHAECSSLSGNLSGARQIEPILTRPGDIEQACPTELRPLLVEFMALRAMKTACVMSYWGRWRDGRELLRTFCPGRVRPLRGLTIAHAASTPAGAAAGWVVRRTVKARAALASRSAGSQSHGAYAGEEHATTVVAHLAASPFFGGPERQMLGLALSLPKRFKSVFFSFHERGLAEPFLTQLRDNGLEAIALKYNAPHLRQAVQEVAGHLRRVKADVVLCHGYKPDLVGWLAARRVGIPIVAVSRGWTWATLRVRLYEVMDRAIYRGADRIVCVSEAQAARVRNAGLADERVTVIRNSIRTERFAKPDPKARMLLEAMFVTPPRLIVGAAGRLSPEKGFADLIEAARIVLREMPDVGFVMFGDGPLRQRLLNQIEVEGLSQSVVLAPFRKDLDRFVPAMDIVALASHTEGLPNVVLEASAAGVPVVATAAGGTSEVIENAVTGYLVPAMNPPAMAERLLHLLKREDERQEMGRAGRQRVQRHFSFDSQSRAYEQLFDALLFKRDRTPLAPVMKAVTTVPVMARSTVSELLSIPLSSADATISGMR